MVSETAGGPVATSAPAVSAPETGRPALGVLSGRQFTLGPKTFDALPGATAVAGTLGDSLYRIEMPDAWNGELVLYAHGYRGDAPQLSVGNPPRALRQAFIDEGYAWAASSYPENGYVPGLGADSTLVLKRYFAREYGTPSRTYLYGDSMGGNVIALSLEHFDGEYDGALSVCGALGGEEQIDYLAAWAMAAEYASGMKITIGEGSGNITAATLLSLSGALGSPDQPTARGRQFISIIRELSGGARPFFLEGFREQYIANFAFLLLDSTRSLPVTKAATNKDVQYAIGADFGISADELNGAIRRILPEPGYRDASAYPDRVPTTAKINAPLLTLHNTGDLFVPISEEVNYLAKATAAGTDGLLVQRAIRDGGHCKFSDAEYTAAWHDLVSWVEDGTKPAGDDFSGDLSDIGRQFTNPLRATDPGTE
jgi:dienelactone hydrolase